MSPEMQRSKLAKLCEIEEFSDENELFAAAISDSVCPAICCNPDNPACDYTTEMEPDQDRGWCEECQAGTMVSVLSCSVGSSDVRRALHVRADRLDGREARQGLVFRTVGQPPQQWGLARPIQLRVERSDDDRSAAPPRDH